MGWRDVMEREELWEDDLVYHDLGSHQVVLLDIGGTVHCYDHRCPHQHNSLRDAEYDPDDCVLICSVHLWEFDPATGDSINPRGERLTRYPVRVQGGVIQVLLDGDGS